MGAAIGLDRLTAAISSGVAAEGPWSRVLEPLATGAGWRDLTAALAELRRVAGAAGGALHVALLPPLIQVRRIELPRLSDDELRAVLGRDVGRYLLAPLAHPVVSVWRRPARRSSLVCYFAAFADANLVASIHGAAAEAGFRTSRVVPAHAAWEAVGRREIETMGRGRGCLVIAHEQSFEVLVFEDGRLDCSRRFAATDDPAAIVDRLVNDHALGEPSTAWAIGAPEIDRIRLEGVLGLRGMSSAVISNHLSLQPPAALAARGATIAQGGELLPQAIRLERWRRERRLSHRLVQAAALMLLFSAALELWGAHRALSRVQAERESLGPLVAQAMEIRQEMEGMQGRLQALTVAESGASRWTSVIADVAYHLPTDAYLLSLRGAKDSLVLEGVAQRAAGVFESLRGAPRVVAVRAEAPIRQESQDSAAPVERFSLGARLAAVGTTVREER